MLAMKSILFALLLSLSLATHDGWSTDFELAKTEAAQSQKYILINFSGSDWCNPCRQMKKQVFDDSIFIKFAHDKLVLVNADFPRSKNNKLDISLQKQNEQLAETYHVEMLPMTILLDANGQEITRWEGKFSGNAKKFVHSLEKSLK
jgi:thioredoxin-related protein